MKSHLTEEKPESAGKHVQTERDLLLTLTTCNLLGEDVFRVILREQYLGVVRQSTHVGLDI